MSDTKPLTERLELMAMMIRMGGRIAYGSDSEIMHEAVAALKKLAAERDALLHRVEKAEKDAEELSETLQKALNRAFQLGQTYWQQADSEYTSQHRKAELTREKFYELKQEIRAAMEASK